jgi:hypothetical protein
MTQPRSSLAIALQDYRGPRPGIALTVAAVALLAAIVVGALHIVHLGRAGAQIEEARQTIRTLHQYDATIEVWRQMTADTAAEFEAQRALRDSIALELRRNLDALRTGLSDPEDRELVGQIYAALEPGADLDPVTAGREAMILLRGRMDAALLRVVDDSQRSQVLAAVLIALTVLAAGVLIIPMSWVYVRYKRGVPPGM